MDNFKHKEEQYDLAAIILGKSCLITSPPIPLSPTQYIIVFSNSIIFEENPRHYIISSVNILLRISKR